MRKSRGITLIEVLVSLAVFTVGVLSLMSIYTLVFDYVNERDDQMQAVAFGQQYMESVRNQFLSGAATASATPSPASAPVDVGYPLAFGVMRYSEASPAPTVAPSANFTASVTSVNTVGSNPSAYDVTVQVTWPITTPTHSSTQLVTLESIIASQVP